MTTVLGQLGDRGVRYQGHVVDVDPVAGLVAPRQTEGSPDEPGERLGPWAGDDVGTDGSAEKIGDQAVGEHGSVAFGDAAVGEGQGKVVASGS